MCVYHCSSDTQAGLTPVPHCLQVMSDHKVNEASYQEKLNAESGRSKSVEEEKELLREQIVDLRKVSNCFCSLTILQLLCPTNDNAFS